MGGAPWSILSTIQLEWGLYYLVVPQIFRFTRGIDSYEELVGEKNDIF